MKFSVLAFLAAAVTTVSASVVITPVFSDQVVPKTGGDCFFGVTTPQGCAPLRKSRT